MCKKNKYCYIAFSVIMSLALLYIVSITIFEVTSPKCYNPVILHSDELQVGNYTFSKEDFKSFDKVNETYFSVCLGHKIPVLRKCCLEKEMLNLEKKCVLRGENENRFDTELKIYNDNNQSLPQYNLLNFYRQYGMISCQNDNPKFINSAHSLILYWNGTLWNGIKNRYIDPDKVCLDMVEDAKTSSLGGLVCPKKQHFSYTIFTVGSAISVPFLLAVFLSFALIKELRTLHGVYIMNYTASLSIFYTFLTIIQILGSDIKENVFCKIAGFTVQFSYLVAFFWLNLMSADVWRSLKNLQPIERGKSTAIERKKILLSSLYGWGVPGIIVIISLIMDFCPGIPEYLPKPQMGKKICILDAKKNLKGTVTYLYGPIVILSSLNLYFLLASAVKIFFVRKETRKLYGKAVIRSKKKSQEFFIYLKLFLAMGIIELMEIVSFLVGGSPYIWLIFDVCLTSQGVFIFMKYFPKINEAILKKFRLDQLQQNSSSSKNCSVPIKSSKNSGEIMMQ